MSSATSATASQPSSVWVPANQKERPFLKEQNLSTLQQYDDNYTKWLPELAALELYATGLTTIPKPDLNEARCIQLAETYADYRSLRDHETVQLMGVIGNVIKTLSQHTSFLTPEQADLAEDVDSRLGPAITRAFNLVFIEHRQKLEEKLGNLQEFKGKVTRVMLVAKSGLNELAKSHGIEISYLNPEHYVRKHPYAEAFLKKYTPSTASEKSRGPSISSIITPATASQPDPVWVPTRQKGRASLKEQNLSAFKQYNDNYQKWSNELTALEVYAAGLKTITKPDLTMERCIRLADTYVAHRPLRDLEIVQLIDVIGNLIKTLSQHTSFLTPAQADLLEDVDSHLGPAITTAFNLVFIEHRQKLEEEFRNLQELKDKVTQAMLAAKIGLNELAESRGGITFSYFDTQYYLSKHPYAEAFLKKYTPTTN